MCERPQADEGLTYSTSGVNIEAGDFAVKLMKDSVKATLNSKVLEGSGGFAGLFDISEVKAMQTPVLATSTDGVGTKVDIARAIDKHNTIGFDLVGMVVDDIAVMGAKPLYMTDYICCGHVVPERIASIVEGVAKACQFAGVALVGGETAEHPGLLADDEYDIAGAASGIIDKKDILGPERVKLGDQIVAIASSGLHSNGFSLVRNVFKSVDWGYERVVDDFQGESLGEILLTPTAIYSPLCLELAKKTDIHTFSHITGGGIAANLARVLPTGLLGVVERSSWDIPRIFTLVQELGKVPNADLEKTLNLGIGMLAILPANDAESAIEICKNNGVNAWVCGEIVVDDAQNIAQNQVSNITSNTILNIVRGTKGVDGGAAVLV